MSTRMNVLVYSGPGTTIESVRHVLYSMRRLLSPKYSIAPVSGDALVKEPWTASCALLVIPGGADLGYCKTLNGEGNRKIAQYVRRGGAFFGFCAGGYYGCGRVEFAVGDPKLEVVGSRELKFFPGTCRGGAFPGFEYASERGARAPLIKVEKGALDHIAPEEFHSYYNGGGVFIDADKYKDNGVEVLARYTEQLNVDGAEGAAAVVYVKFGEGRVVLTSPHPEFAGINLDKNAGDDDYSALVDTILRDDKKRVAFLKAMLIKLGLNVNEDISAVPTLSKLHLTAIYPEDVGHLQTNLKEIITKEGESELIVGENDTFVLEKSQGLSLWSSSKALEEPAQEDKIIDYDKIRKHICLHDRGYPPKEDTPYFNHDLYFHSLKKYRAQSRSSASQFGSFILYGEVLTSTNTILDKNFNLLQRLPSGLTTVATTQVAGRGRGTNTWVSPMGCLLFSMCLRHPVELSIQAPVVFVQYLTGLAVVEAVKTYGPGYRDMPVKLKWPNDIYAEDPSADKSSKEKQYVKIGGILVNSSYANNQFLLVIGCGINTTNKLPTTSLNILLESINSGRRRKGLQPLPSFQPEKLLAKFLVVFEEMYYKFSLLGFKPFEKQYYENWIHSNQIVRLEMENGTQARIRGITLDHGLLIADEIYYSSATSSPGYDNGNDVRLTGKTFTLQSDGNSFDFMKGLLRKKG